jgi:hypothetical protein
MEDGKAENRKGRGGEEIDPSEHISLGVLGDGNLQHDDQGQEKMQVEPIEVDTENDGLDGDEDAVARRQIMQGAIVKSVMTSAAEGMCLIGSLFMSPYIWPSLHCKKFDHDQFRQLFPKLDYLGS